MKWKDLLNLDLDTKKIVTPDDIYKLVKLEDYQFHPAIKADMAV
jgi:thymidylate synthase